MSTTLSSTDGGSMTGLGSIDCSGAGASPRTGRRSARRTGRRARDRRSVMTASTQDAKPRLGARGRRYEPAGQFIRHLDACAGPIGGRARFDGGMREVSVIQRYRSLIIGATAVAPLVACAVLALFRDSVANTNAALGLVLIVVAAAATGIRTAAVVAAVSAFVWFDFFLTEPFHTFTITDQAAAATAVLLLLVGLAVTEIALWGRRQQARASREQGYLDGVLRTAATVAAGQPSTGALIEQVGRQITEVLQIDDCRFDPAGYRESGVPTINNDGSLTRNGHTLNVDRNGLPTDSEIVLPVQSGGVVHGRFLLTASTRVVRPTSEQLRVAVALANQVGAALTAPQAR